MKRLDWLNKIRGELVGSIIDSNDVELEDHDVGDGNVFKLHYVNYHRIGYKKSLGVIDWFFDPFMIPEGMTKEEAFKVLSYLTDFIEANTELEECSLGSVRALNDAINLPRFGFRRLKNKVEAISLYTVAGRLNEFKKSKFYDTYFEWYTPNVTREEVVAIYDRIGKEFSDVVISGPTSIKQLKL